VDVGSVGRCKELGSLLCEGREIQARARQEVLRLTNIHPEALEIEGVELPVRANGGENFLLNRCGAELDSPKNRWFQDVDTSIDTVAYEFDRFLNEAVDAGGVIGLMNHDAVF
jgi:hypothetical protein